jgi:hypothetical protein
MQTFTIIHDDISGEPASSLVEVGPTAYQGRHVRLDVPGVEAAPVQGAHPRRRGFGILSRLARVDGPDSADTGADHAPVGAHAALTDA